MFDFDKIAQEHGSIEIGVIENKITNLIEKQKNAHHQSTMLLWYLRRSRRFTENPDFEKSTFEIYLRDKFDLKPHQFEESLQVWTHYPDEAAKYGVGFVKATQKKCSPSGTQKAFQEIRARNAKRKTPIGQKDREAIVEKHANPKIIKEITDYKSMYEEEQRKRLQAEEQVKLVELENTALKEQVDKLKEALATMRNLQASILEDLGTVGDYETEPEQAEAVAGRKEGGTHAHH